MSDENTVYELTVDVPGSPKGDPIQIPGLGTFDNGGTYAITKREADSFRTHHSRQVPVTEEDGTILGSRVELGPTLLQSSKVMYGVEVSSVGKDEEVDTRGKSNTSGDEDTSKMVPQAPAVPVESDDADKSSKKKGGDQSWL